MSRPRRMLTLLASLSASLAAMAADAVAADFDFRPGVEGFEMTPIVEGEPATLAGSHPFVLRAAVNFVEEPSSEGGTMPVADVRSLLLRMPPGLFANPRAVPRCAATDFQTPRSSPFAPSASGESCPRETQVGTVQVRTGGDGSADRRFGLFNLAPPPGAPAAFGFAPFGAPIVFVAQLREGANGEYALSLEARNISQARPIEGLELALWGTPWGVAHNGERGECLNELEPEFPWAKCSVGPPASFRPLAFLTLPTDCDEPLVFTATATAWQQPAPVSASHVPEADGQPLVPEGCADLDFEPTALGQLTDRKASSPTGFAFALQNDPGPLTDPAGRLPSQVRRAALSLPQGVTVNPSVAAGLDVCRPAQLARETAGSAEGAGCPNGAKIGDFTVDSPLLDAPLAGSVYLAQPDDPTTSAPGAENPFDSLLAIYLVARSQSRGILVRLAGRLTADPLSGRLSATFGNLPQLPYTRLQANLRSGQRAALVTPSVCGSAVATVDLLPSASGPPPVRRTTVSPIDSGAEGAACPSGAPPFAPQAVAGSVNSNVGSYSPFFLRLSRRDAEQEIVSYSALLPKGVTGRLAGIPFCPEAAIAAARLRGGAAELATPSCPAASEVGRTFSGYGVGSALAYAGGRMYLAGPYRGSPLSIVTINAATVGPFDLGTIVVRSAFDVDPATARLSIDSEASDPIPHIVRGIPLHLRDVRVFVDRPSFIRNPSSCAPSQVISTLSGAGARFGDPSDDSLARVSNHFQLLNCRTLGFRPKLGMRLRGPSRRGAYPSLRVVFASRGRRDSNLKAIEVTMPRSQFLAQNHIAGICTREQFAAERCPSSSVYGKAVAHTPLLDAPLRGNAYLRSSSHRLPDLVISLRSGAVRIVVAGQVGQGRRGLRVRFAELPDAPLDRFVLTMFGGRRGLLVNSTDICKSKSKAVVKALGQNDRGVVFAARLRGNCGKGGRKR